MDVYQRRRLVALSGVAAVFVIIVLLIRSCGGDDEEAAPLSAPVTGATGLAGAALTEEQFADQGDAICLESNTAIAAVDSSDADQAAEDTAEILAGQLDSLRSLTLAPGEEGDQKLEGFLSALQKQVQAYDERALAVERGDEGAVAEIDATIEEEAADAAQAAKKFGFDVCGDTSEVSDSSSGEEATESDADTATDSEAAAPAPVTPAPTTAAPTTPAPTTPAPVDTGGGTAAPAPAPAPADTGDGSSSGGLAP